jgi:hypothetical protein
MRRQQLRLVGTDVRGASIRPVSVADDLERVDSVAGDAPPCASARARKGAAASDSEYRCHRRAGGRPRGANEGDRATARPLPASSVDQSASLLFTESEGGGLFDGHDAVLVGGEHAKRAVIDHRNSVLTRCDTSTVTPVILPNERDPRLTTIRRGGTLTDADHRLLALWAATCAEHVLHLFESAQPSDPRPRAAIEQIRTWARGEIRMSDSRAAGGHAMAAARPLRGPARHAAFAAGQAAVVAHVAAHELGAAAYAIKAVRAAAPNDDADAAGRRECRWQRARFPNAIRELLLDDQRRRNAICWSVFEP